jgi:hypothetical protein
MKAQTFCLYSGFVETQSWYSLNLQHNEGFKTVEDAFNSLHDAFMQWVKEACDNYPWEDGNYLLSANRDSEGFVEALTKQIEQWFRGDMQSHGDMWEILQNNGWSNNIEIPVSTKTIINVSRAPELIANVKEWPKSDNKDYSPNWYRREHSHPKPKGLKITNNE